MCFFYKFMIVFYVIVGIGVLKDVGKDFWSKY